MAGLTPRVGWRRAAAIWAQVTSWGSGSRKAGGHSDQMQQLSAQGTVPKEGPWWHPSWS